MDNVGENNGFHYKILLFRSTSPVSISLTLGDSDAEVIELKSHETYEDACISKVNQKIVDQKVVVNPSQAKKVWSIVQIDDGDLCASTSSTSSFSIINESLSNDNDCNQSTIYDFKNDGDNCLLKTDSSQPESTSISNKCESNSETVETLNLENVKSEIVSKCSLCLSILDDVEYKLESEAFMEFCSEYLKKIEDLQPEDSRIKFLFVQSLVVWSEKNLGLECILSHNLKLMRLESLSVEQRRELLKMGPIRRSVECRVIISIGIINSHVQRAKSYFNSWRKCSKKLNSKSEKSKEIVKHPGLDGYLVASNKSRYLDNLAMGENDQISALEQCFRARFKEILLDL